MGNKIRSLFVVVSFALLSLLAFRSISLQVKKVNAIPGALEMGTGTLSTTYYNNDSVYRSNLLFGNGTGGRGGVLDYKGKIDIAPTGAVTNTVMLEVNDAARIRRVVVGPTSVPVDANSKSLDVRGDANIQGNVGIGYGVTTSLGDIPLHVKQDAVGASVNIVTLESADSTIHLGETGGNLTTDTSLNLTGNILSNGTGANYFVGSVGIGTLTPGGLLDINSDSTSNGIFIDGRAALTGVSTDNWIRLNQGSAWTSGVYTPGAMRVDGELRQGTTDAGAYALQTAGDLYVAGSGLLAATGGNVGIGTTSPAALLHVRKAAEAGTAETLAQFSMADDSTAVLKILNQTNTDAAFNPQIYTKNTFDRTALQITAEGTNDTAGNTTPNMVFNSTRGGTGFTNRPLFAWAEEGAYHMTMNSNGNVGIGTTAPNQKLKVAGSIHDDTSDNANLNQATYEISGNNIGGQTLYAYGAMCVGNSSGTCATASSGTLFNNSANYITGATTFASNATFNGSATIAGGVYTNDWFRNNNANQGLYNTATARHFYSQDTNYWAMNSDHGMVLRNGHAGTITGYLYWDGTAGSNSFGLLSSNGAWKVRTDNSNVELYGGAYMASAYANIYYDRQDTGYYVNPNSTTVLNALNLASRLVIDGSTVIDDGAGWHRSYGNTGWYNGTYGGGMYMTDSSYVRVYNNKHLYVSYVYSPSGNYQAGGTTYGEYGISALNGWGGGLNFSTDGSASLWYGDGFYCGACYITFGYDGSTWENAINLWGGDLNMRSNEIREASYILTRAGDAHLWIRNSAGTNAFALRTSDGYGHGKTWVSNWKDLAENMHEGQGQTLEKGDLVMADPTNRNHVVRTTEAYQSNVLGVISTQPGLLMNQDVAGNDNRGKPVSLAGRAPMKVTTMNGNIKIGDPLASSPIPGVAMRATKAGRIIGYAMEAFPYNQEIGDVSLDAMDQTPYRTEYEVGGNKVGKISAFINPAYFDPDLKLDREGELKLEENGAGFAIKDKEGDVITRLASFAKVIAAKVQAGVIDTKRLIVDGVDILKKLNETESALQRTTKLVETQEAKIKELELRLKKLEK